MSIRGAVDDVGAPTFPFREWVMSVIPGEARISATWRGFRAINLSGAEKGREIPGAMNRVRRDGRVRG